MCLKEAAIMLALASLGVLTSSVFWCSWKKESQVAVHLRSCLLMWLSSVTQLCPTLCNPMDCSIPGLPLHHQLLEPAKTHVHQVSDAIQPSQPLSSPSSPAFSLSQYQRYFPMSQFFAWGGQSIGASPSVNEYSLMNEYFHEYSGLISFRINWFDLLGVQGTLKSLLQHHSSKASILQCSAFFIV